MPISAKCDDARIGPMQSGNKKRVEKYKYILCPHTYVRKQMVITRQNSTSDAKCNAEYWLVLSFSNHTYKKQMCVYIHIHVNDNQETNGSLEVFMTTNSIEEGCLDFIFEYWGIMYTCNIQKIIKSWYDFKGVGRKKTAICFSNDFSQATGRSLVMRQHTWELVRSSSYK